MKKLKKFATVVTTSRPLSTAPATVETNCATTAVMMAAAATARAMFQPVAHPFVLVMGSG